MRGLFITGIGTGVGKTYVTRALASSLRHAAKRVTALKPLETGYVNPLNSDSLALAVAAGHADPGPDSGFYRAMAPLSPYAATLGGEQPPPSVRALVDAIHRKARGFDFTLVEGAGGLLVPLDSRCTTAELVAALGLPLLVVAPNQLGVLSSVLTTVECARHRSIEVRGVVLVDPIEGVEDPSSRTNARILDERLGIPVFEFPRVANDDAALGAASLASGLLSVAIESRS
ncbi:MAG: hypothetical protein RL385_289 [Pseudomonadota bacterium]|jgi:dethiobiotin synthetase